MTHNSHSPARDSDETLYSTGLGKTRCQGHQDPSKRVPIFLGTREALIKMVPYLQGSNFAATYCIADITHCTGSRLLSFHHTLLSIKVEFNCASSHPLREHQLSNDDVFRPALLHAEPPVFSGWGSVGIEELWIQIWNGARGPWPVRSGSL